jgi:hypothetical protein
MDGKPGNICLCPKPSQHNLNMNVWEDGGFFFLSIYFDPKNKIRKSYTIFDNLASEQKQSH